MVDKVNKANGSLQHIDFRKLTEFKHDFKEKDPYELVKKIVYGNFKAGDAFYSYDVNNNIVGFTDQQMRGTLYDYAGEIVEAYQTYCEDPEGYLLMLEGQI